MEEKAEEEIDENTIYRTCRICKESKPLTEFYKHGGCKLGRASTCKACQSIKQKQYYKDHRPKINERQKHYYITNKSKILKHVKYYRDEHKLEIAERKKKIS